MQREPRVRDFSRVVFFTGAGISAESGVPTFRGPGGIWKEYDFHTYACQEAFDRDPARVWEFHNYRRQIVAAAAPNAGHAAIAAAQKSLNTIGSRPTAGTIAPPSRRSSKLTEVTVVTQNIDGLHQRAGSAEVLELHGSLWRVRCDRCVKKAINHDVPFVNQQCPTCSGSWRPDITWFGDPLNVAVMDRVLEATDACDLFVTVGTSGMVMPAAAFPVHAKKRGAFLVEVNPEETQLSELHDHCLRGTATEMLGRLCEGL